MRALHERACGPLADARRHPEAFYAGLRLVAIDGSNLELADEAANAAAFGYPGSRTGHAAYPQAQCASHAILAANLGAYRCPEWEICEPLLTRMDESMLCLADRGFNGYRYWQAACATGAQLLWRCAANRVVTALPDGSYLSTIYPDPKSRRKQTHGITLRVIEYSLPGKPEAQPRYRLLTTLLDPRHARASELAALYQQRWEVEAVFDESKTSLRQSRRVLRSKTPDGVHQEFYGWVLAHYAVCWLMQQAAYAGRLKRQRLSFIGHVQLIRRTMPHLRIPGPFPPTRPRLRKRWFDALLREGAGLRCVSSRGLSRPRHVKRRHSPYASFQRPRPPPEMINADVRLLGPMPLSVRRCG